MSEVADALRTATNLLSMTSDTPRLDAELLLAHALGVQRGDMLLDPARFTVPERFTYLVARRMAYEPIAYILGVSEFWSLRFEVGPGVLIPRPDSETLIEACLDHFDKLRTGFARHDPEQGWPRTILDLGTGPGTLLLAALSEFPDARGLGVDASEQALAYARDNAEDLGLADRAAFRAGNWGEGIDETFDIILCNPPYIADGERLMPDVADHEPPGALFAGADGLDDYRRIIPDLPRLLAPRGFAVLEIGATQHMLVGDLAKAAGFAVACRQDLAGRDRALLLTRA